MQKVTIGMMIIACAMIVSVANAAPEVTNQKVVTALKEYAADAPNQAVQMQRLMSIAGYLVTDDEKLAWYEELLPQCKTQGQKDSIAIARANILNAQGRTKDAVAVYEAMQDAGNYGYIRQIVANETDPQVALKYKKGYLLEKLGIRAPSLNSNELLFVLKSIRPDECDDYAAFLEDVLRFYRVFQVDCPNLIPFITQVEATIKSVSK